MVAGVGHGGGKVGFFSMHLLYGILILGGMFFLFYLLGKDIEPREGG